MGLGLVLSALSGAGKSVAESANDYQKFNDQQAMQKAASDRQKANEIDLAKVRSDLQVEANNRIAEANLKRETDPINRFQKIVSGYLDKFSNDPSLVSAAAQPEPAAIGASSSIPSETDTSGSWNDINASFKEGEPARNNARLETLQAELANETDPDNIAALKREISRLPAADPTASPTTSAGATASTDAVSITKDAIQKAAFLAAVADAKVNDPLAYKAAADTYKGEHVLVGQGGAIVDPLTKDIVYHNDTAENIARMKVDAADARSKEQISARERMLEMKYKNAADAKVVDPKSVEAAASMIASYGAKPIGDRVRATPFGQAVIARVKELNPDYNEIRYGQIDKAVKAFATGKQGDIVRSLNVAIDHIGTAEGLIDAMKNGDINIVNKLKNKLAAETGSTAPVNFEAVKGIVADEITKSVVGGPGALADREEMAKQIRGSNSPEQIRGVLDQFKHLMRGQLNGLQSQYERSTGYSDFDTFLSPAVKAALVNGESNPTPSPSTAAGAVPTTAKPGVINFGDLK